MKKIVKGMLTGEDNGRFSQPPEEVGQHDYDIPPLFRLVFLGFFNSVVCFTHLSFIPLFFATGGF